jgi:cytochrome c-type biogenesis protein CcmH
MSRSVPRFWRSTNLKLAVAFFTVIAAVIAQDPTSYLTPSVMRVGEKLACRCGGCRNTVGNCPMLRCDSADPMRRRIFQMQSSGMGDKQIIDNIVRQEGIVALASPPGQGLGPVVTWVMPGVALAVGVWIWSWYVRRNRRQPQPLTPVDAAVLERFRTQIDRELDEPSGASRPKQGPA